LKSVGFGVAERSAAYHPFELTMTLKKMNPSASRRRSSSSNTKDAGIKRPESDLKATVNNNLTGPQNNNVYLMIMAKTIKSAYQCKY